MIRTLLLAFTLVVALQAIDIDEKYIREMANNVRIGEEEVRTCASKTSITEDDIAYHESYSRQRSQTTDLDDRDKKVGCFFACMLQKKGLMSGARWNADKVKEMYNFTVVSERMTKQLQQVDTCVDQIKNETNECEAAVKGVTCFNK